MRGNAVRGQSSGALRVVRRVWPVAALLVAGMAVTASPSLHALLVALIWASWSLVAVLGVHALGLRVPAPWRAALRRSARRLAVRARVRSGRLLDAAGRGWTAARTGVVVQVRRVRARREERLQERAARGGGESWLDW